MTTAYVAIEDRAMRERIADLLHRRGHAVVAHATGFHLLADLADVLEGRSRETPGLIVVDAFARGCAGLTIAAGLRDLGVTIPLVLIARPGAQLPVSDDGSVHVVSAEHAVSAVSELQIVADRERVGVAGGGHAPADEGVAGRVERRGVR